MLIFITALNSVRRFLKLFAFLFAVTEIFVCLLLIPHIKLVPLLDVYQLQISFGEILIYLVNISLNFIVFESSRGLPLVAFVYYLYFIWDNDVPVIICLLLLLFLVPQPSLPVFLVLDSARFENCYPS